MPKRKDSDSTVQREIEEYVFDRIVEKLRIPELEHNDELIPLKGNPKVKINPDFYSEDHRIIGEIHAHLGRLKASQVKKVATDVLKMLLFEKDFGEEFEKYIIVCDQKELEQLEGNSYLAETISQFNVHPILVDLPQELHEKLDQAMKAQNFYFTRRETDA